jgi:ribonuclease HIII
LQSLSEKAKEQIYNLRNSINANGYSSDSIIKKEYNYEFSAINETGKVKILLYFGKKGLKLILQGDINSSLYKSVFNLTHEQQSLDLGEKEIEEPNDYIGTDEVGKGDLFGPLVIAAVRVDDSMQIKLRKSGVRDSKDLSDYQIEIIAKKIKDICQDNIAVVSLIPEKYNQLYEKDKNLNKLLSYCHSKAIEELLDNTDAKIVISDKFGNKGLDIHRNASYSHIKFIDTEKAERFIGVAAASIIARNEFIQWFYEQEKDNFNFPKGSSDKAKIFLERFIKTNGKDDLYRYAKLHFKTIKNSI